MKTKTFKNASAFALVLTSLATFATVSADFSSEVQSERPSFEERTDRSHRFGGKRGFGMKRHGRKNEAVEKNVEITSDSLIHTITTTDSEALEKLFSRADRMIEKNREGVSVEKISNGIRVTQTPADAEKFEKMKARAEKRQMWKQVTMSHEKISNGIKTTKTSDNTEVVAMLQAEKSEKMGRRGHKNTSHSVENITNGVIITMTSDDAEKVAKMHARIDQKNAK